uniref:Uncharacterized protein n=1 Tax=Globisporangium ultimum (strain ATCC 200006 / CBS 805.95 / DAOM BR144) TaxID=431595 RepID=K3X7Q7_GLOUD
MAVLQGVVSQDALNVMATVAPSTTSITAAPTTEETTHEETPTPSETASDTAKSTGGGGGNDNGTGGGNGNGAGTGTGTSTSGSVSTSTTTSTASNMASSTSGSNGNGTGGGKANGTGSGNGIGGGFTRSKSSDSSSTSLSTSTSNASSSSPSSTGASTVSGTGTGAGRGIGWFSVLTLLNDGDVELRALRSGDNWDTFCGGAPVLVTKSLAHPENKNCIDGWTNLSCTCLSDLQDPATSWEIYVTKLLRDNGDGIVPNATTTSRGAPVAITSIGTFGIPATLTTLEIANVSLTGVDIASEFLPPTLVDISLRNCNLTTLSGEFLSKHHGALERL